MDCIIGIHMDCCESSFKMYFKCLWKNASNYALIRKSNIKNDMQIINAFLLSFILCKFIKLYLKWHNEGLNETKMHTYHKQ